MEREGRHAVPLFPFCLSTGGVTGAFVGGVSLLPHAASTDTNIKAIIIRFFFIVVYSFCKGSKYSSICVTVKPACKPL